MSRRLGLILVVATFFVVMLCSGSIDCGGAYSPSAPSAPTAGIGGAVTDAATNARISGAAITVAPTGASSITATTGPDGVYFVSGFPPGQVTVTAKATGYVDFSKTVTANVGSNTLNIALTRTP